MMKPPQDGLAYGTSRAMFSFFQDIAREMNDFFE